jgi:hypothetical protein
LTAEHAGNNRSTDVSVLFLSASSERFARVLGRCACWIGLTFWRAKLVDARRGDDLAVLREAIGAVSSRRAMVTGLSSTAPLALSTTQTAGCVPRWKWH